ncbi:MAG: InlB B-repeat-containing protein [Anaeroplasmataceae bacterium]|nr:InlB B-repeat-containing protein [Anaeroplasmataceae bacterium]
MKKIIVGILCLLLGLTLVSCNETSDNSEENKMFTITYNLNGYGDNSVLTDVEKLPDELPMPNYSGYQFIGWYYEDDTKAVEGTILKEDVTLYAKWEKIATYSVKFDSVSGSKVEDILDVVKGSKISKPTDPVKKGFEFDGWYKEADYKNEWNFNSDIVEKNLTLYAKWKNIDPDAYLSGYEQVIDLEDKVKNNLSVGGYASNGDFDFRKYKGTDAYRVVTTPLEFLTAIKDAKYDYTSTWDADTKTLNQTLNKEGSVHVIEIANDLNMGYFKLGAEEKATNIVSDYANKMENLKPYLCMSDMVLENGISQIKIENTSNLLIYSKNGAKLTHCGFKLTTDANVAFRNLEFDEMWQWEDAPVETSNAIGDYDFFGWAYFKISFCEYIWIDHCTFGKSYDGQIDYANPVYTTTGTAFRAPYGAKGDNGLHISWCSFNAGSDDKDGYLYKMMDSIEQEYLAGKKNYLYYNSLRDAGISFEDILYGIAIPQKKGFLCGDDAKFSSVDSEDDYNFNLKLKVSFANTVFKNIEDRLPKLRGGNAYMYDCVVDCSQYYAYRFKLLTQRAASAVQSVNSGWKCALVSQGIVCGNGGSVQAENCMFRGIDTLIKHNDKKNVSPYVDGGYQIVNCQYQKGEDSQLFYGSSSDYNSVFISSNPILLNTDNFSWKTEDGKAPFEVDLFRINKLEENLNSIIYGCGTKGLSEMYLKMKYND